MKYSNKNELFKAASKWKKGGDGLFRRGSRLSEHVQVYSLCWKKVDHNTIEIALRNEEMEFKKSSNEYA